MNKVSLNVGGMRCRSCVLLVEDALKDSGASQIKISLDEKKQIGKVSFECENKEKAIKAIESEGYKVVWLK